MNSSSKINSAIDTSLHDDGDDNLSPLPNGPQYHDSNLGKMKYSLPNYNSTLDKDILSNFLKNDNSPEQQTKSHNTTEDIAASLGLEQNESVGWTSALETPNIGEENGKKKKILSTIEKLTLHPTRELRQSVLARALFSPLFDNNKECSKSLVSNTLSPIAKNLENGSSCQSNVIGSKTIMTLEEDEPVKPLIDDTSFNQSYGIELCLSTNKSLNNNKKITSVAMTSTPISVKRSEYNHTIHLRKCLDDTFSKISPNNRINNFVKNNGNESSYAVEDICDISHKSSVQCVDDKESLDINANSNYASLRKANVSELFSNYSCSKKNHLDSLSSSNANSSFRSKLSLKHRKTSKFIYPVPDENLDFENDPNKKLCNINMEKISEPIANKFLRQQCNFNSLLPIISNNNFSNMIEIKSSVVDTCKIKKINSMENKTNNCNNDGSEQVIANLSLCDNDKNSGLPKFTATKVNKEKGDIISKQDTLFLRYNSQTENGCTSRPNNIEILASNEIKNSSEYKPEESASPNEKVSYASSSLKSCQDIFLNRLEEPVVILKDSPSEWDNGKFVEAVTNSKYPDKFSRFQYESGKKVDVSDASFKNIQNIWDEQPHPNRESDQTVLKTGKDASLNSSEILCNNNYGKSNHIGDVWNRSAKTVVNELAKSFTGFESGSGKKICVSEASLRNVQNLWNECSQPDESIENLKSNTNTGFQTVSGKKITVAEKSLKLVHTMWEECDKSGVNTSLIIDSPQSSKIEVSTNSCTIEKNLAISDTSSYSANFENNSFFPLGMKECKKATRKFLGEKKCVTQFNNYEQSNISKKELKFQGANNYDKLNNGERFSGLPTSEDIKLGEMGSLNCRKSFNDYGKMDNNLVFENISVMSSKEEIKCNDFGQLQNEVNLKPKLCFQTASNKPVEISNGALLKAKCLWNNISDDITTNSFSSTPNRVENMVVGVTAPESSANANERSLSPVFGSFRKKRPTCKSKFRRRTLVSEFVSRFELDKHDLHRPEVFTGIENYSDINSYQKTKFQFVTGNGKSVDVQEESVLLAIKVLNQEPVNEKVMSINQNDSSILVSRVVPDFSAVLNCEDKFSNKPTDDLNGHNYLATQDFIEINKISEAFMLDNSWDDLSQAHKELPSLTNKRDTAESELSDNVKRKRKKLNDSSDKKRKNINSSREISLKKKDEIVQSNSKEVVENTHGLLYQKKVCKSLSQVKLSSIKLYKNTGLSSHPMENLMPHNIANWRFEMDDKASFSSGYYDGFRIIPGCDSKVGVEEIEQAFLTSTVVNSSFVPDKWVLNHYKWIVWKLASYQQKMDCFSQKPFSLIELVKQIRYRYDVEMLEGRRSVIRKIFEQDDLPQKTMILCISEINYDSSKADGHLSPLVLTDGWYSIGAQIDSSMMNLLQRNVIKVGFKLILHGSELIGTPSPCHPLENSEAVQLKIHTNMIRIANWYSKLGLYKFGGPIPSTNISCILDGGGHVGTLDVIVVRKYPLIYMEKVGGKTIMYNERAHDKKIQDDEMKKQSFLQEIYSQVAKDLEEEETVINDLDFIKDLPNQKEIYKSLSLSNDSNYLESLLKPEQLMEVHKWKEQKRSERNILIQNEVQKRFEAQNKLSEIVPMLKLGVVDKKGTYAIITVWRPQEGILQLLKEGKSYRIHFIAASETRNGIKQLTWNKHSRIMEISDIKPKSYNYHRKVASFNQINLTDANNVPWSEMDVVGIVVRISEPKDGRQVVYLADHCANLLSLKFWPSIQDFGVSNILEIGSCVSVCNASWKGKCGGTPTLHITSHTVISSSPAQKYLQEAMHNAIGAIQDISQFLSTFNFGIEETSNEVTSLPETMKQQLSPKFKRTEIKRSKEIAGKMNTLSKHYGALSPIQTIQIKTSPLITKPFKVPLRYGKSPTSGK